MVLNPGDRAVLIGEEGNGKSTLLKWICDPRLVEPYAEAAGQMLAQLAAEPAVRGGEFVLRPDERAAARIRALEGAVATANREAAALRDELDGVREELLKLV